MGNFQYGGQAVIEGVMMRGPALRAVAVRRPDATLVLDTRPVGSLAARVPLLKWPFIRGVVVLVESLVMGLEALSFSASQAVEEEEELTTRDIILTLAVALALGIFLFVVLPAGLAHLLAGFLRGPFLQNLVEGVIRLGVFLLYVVSIGMLPDIRRVFQYHGAEHKVINAYEAGDELVVSRVQQYSTFHPRCGTSFILIVLVVSIFLFSLLGEQVLWWRVTSRILLLPLLAGVSYELLKLSARYPRFFLCRLFIIPGRWLQGLTTREPDDDQVEVAIAALGAVLGGDARYAGKAGQPGAAL
ncbi:Uncharacterized conserved protein YqhQ [Desulfofundulus australicus DSM 11792]|jgi:uncharacterized protein YqhQ|uniref:Uncharacterized conserved protein YqhQ n=1 Tax=Desulfofundulus australicus DSM 11792 TaxID=1121425 RepID=A0A1M4YKX0_9FIRM|nr:MULTISPECIES: DUF1385 domain-containing protein [Desulfofundulus]MBE3586806.1 DUF1385 domain-containing protein [Thermoanaerobacter sp.]MDK2888641.1 hypothetical protein [Thermoanaerobacter sp.]SHF06404.1 Uncharacterized conserved protein YqhQ [Desulfofundulus australicus DSM 11792]